MLISVKIVNFSQICEFQFKLWISVQIVKVSQDSINSFWSWIDEKSEKSALANTVSLKEQIPQVKMASSRNEDCLGDMFGLPAEKPWTFFSWHLFLRHGGSQYTQFCHCRNVIFFHNRPLFSNFPLLGHWKPSWHSWQLGNLTTQMVAISIHRCKKCLKSWLLIGRVNWILTNSGSFALGFFSKFNRQSHLPHWYTTSKISDFQSFSDFSNFYAWNHIVLYTIYMHQNRFITPFLTPIWKSDPHSPPDSTTSEIASYTISQIKLFEVDILLIWKRKILRKFGLNRSGETNAVKRV